MPSSSPARKRRRSRGAVRGAPARRGALCAKWFLLLSRTRCGAEVGAGSTVLEATRPATPAVRHTEPSRTRAKDQAPAPLSLKRPRQTTGDKTSLRRPSRRRVPRRSVPPPRMAAAQRPDRAVQCLCGEAIRASCEARRDIARRSPETCHFRRLSPTVGQASQRATHLQSHVRRHRSNLARAPCPLVRSSRELRSREECAHASLTSDSRAESAATGRLLMVTWTNDRHGSLDRPARPHC